MIKIFSCRRSSIALIGMLLLTIIGLKTGVDVSAPLAAICIGIAGANAYQGKNVIKA